MKIRNLINRIFGGAKVKTNDPSVKVEPCIIRPTAIKTTAQPSVKVVIQESLAEKHDRERIEKIRKEEEKRR